MNNDYTFNLYQYKVKLKHFSELQPTRNNYTKRFDSLLRTVIFKRLIITEMI